MAVDGEVVRLAGLREARLAVADPEVERPARLDLDRVGEDAAPWRLRSWRARGVVVHEVVVKDHEVDRQAAAVDPTGVLSGDGLLSRRLNHLHERLPSIAVFVRLLGSERHHGPGELSPGGQQEVKPSGIKTASDRGSR